MTSDLDRELLDPIIVQYATRLPSSDEGWSTAPDVTALSTRAAAGNDVGSTQLDMKWGQIFDPNREDSGLERPDPPLDIDHVVRLVQGHVDDAGRVEMGDELWVGVVTEIEDSDPQRSTVKAIDLAGLLAKTRTSRGWELDASGALLVDPGYLPPANALPGGDCSTTSWAAGGPRVFDRRGSGEPWTAYRFADLLLQYGMRPDLPGAPSDQPAIPWRLDPDSPAELDYELDLQQLHGKSIGECMDALFGSRRGLTYVTTTAAGYAQVLVIDLDAPGTTLDTAADLGWENPRVQRRRDGYDYVVVSGARPLVGITLWWTRGVTGGALEPDGWDPATADAALNAALQADYAGKAYDRPEWRRFRLRGAWDGSQYDGSAGGSGTIGLRGTLIDPETYAPPDGDRWFLPPSPPPTSLSVDRDVPAGLGWTDDATGPRQQPIVIAGADGRWEDLSKECRPTPVGGIGGSARSDQNHAIILLGETAEDADRLRTAVSTSGSILVTIGVREWAPLQAAWSAPASAWSAAGPRVYPLQRPGLEEWLCLAGCVTAVKTDGTLDSLADELAVRSDVEKLRTIRDQLAVRYGRAIAAATIERHTITRDWLPGDIISDLVLVDGRAFELAMPCAEVEWTWTFPRRTRIRWAPLFKEVPSA